MRRRRGTIPYPVRRLRRRRLPRILLNAATAVSLVLFVVTAGLWARSYFASDRVRFESQPDSRGDIYFDALILHSGSGGIGFLHNRLQYPDDHVPGRMANMAYHHWRYDAFAPAYPNAAPVGRIYWRSNPSRAPFLLGQTLFTAPY
jgi:hypothetical protein